jgi:nitrite reductase (cytochrome c-552)
MSHQKTRLAHRRGGWVLYVLVVVLTAAATLGVAALLANIAQRKREALLVAFPLTNLTEQTIDPAEWGKNFPRQYDGYIRTADNERRRFGGSESPTLRGDGPAGEPRPVSKLEEDPKLKIIFNGYPFAVDYREKRGHAFMLHDQRETERVKQFPQPGACLNCHSSTVVAFRKAGLEHGAGGTLDDPLLSPTGQAQLWKGFEVVNPMAYAEATKLVDHPITCLDCHDPRTMALRITRPAFVYGIRALAESNAPVPHLPSIEQWRRGTRARPYDPNLDASRQEMRSMACAQCHVEYYFKGPGKTLTYPWHKGLKAEQIEAYYDEVGWVDFRHRDTGAPVLKAQHPEFELWSQGVHARSGVSCADCHMPYTRQGAVKISDHQIRSPLLNVARSCQVCHNYTESEILARVETIQVRTKNLMERAEVALVSAIRAIASARSGGIADEHLAEAWKLQRAAQWRVDFINAENSMGFHAPQEAARILGEAIDFARQAELEAVRARSEPRRAAALPR